MRRKLSLKVTFRWRNRVFWGGFRTRWGFLFSGWDFRIVCGFSIEFRRWRISRWISLGWGFAFFFVRGASWFLWLTCGNFSIRLRWHLWSRSTYQSVYCRKGIIRLPLSICSDQQVQNYNVSKLESNNNHKPKPQSTTLSTNCTHA